MMNTYNWKDERKKIRKKLQSAGMDFQDNFRSAFTNRLKDKHIYLKEFKVATRVEDKKDGVDFIINRIKIDVTLNFHGKNKISRRHQFESDIDSGFRGKLNFGIRRRNDRVNFDNRSIVLGFSTTAYRRSAYGMYDAIYNNADKILNIIEELNNRIENKNSLANAKKLAGVMTEEHITTKDERKKKRKESKEKKRNKNNTIYYKKRKKKTTPQAKLTKIKNNIEALNDFDDELDAYLNGEYEEIYG